MDSTFLKILTGSRMSNYMGLEINPGYQHVHGKNYLYLEIPVLAVADAEGLEVKRNQHVLIQAACSVNVKGRNIILVEPNQALAEHGQIQGAYMIHPESGKQQIGFWFTARKDVNLADLKYAVRLYLYA